jgi:hypothetical protein
LRQHVLSVLGRAEARHVEAPNTANVLLDTYRSRRDLEANHTHTHTHAAPAFPRVTVRAGISVGIDFMV